MSVKADKPEREYRAGIAVAAKLRSNSLSDMVAHGVSHA